MTDQTESNIVLERAIIWKILHDAESGHQIIGYLKPMHFSASQHETIYAAIEDSMLNGQESSLLVVLSKLDTTGNLEKAGGQAYIEEIYEDTYEVESVKTLADIVIKAYLVRAAKTIGYQMQKLNKNDQEGIESFLTQINHQIDNLVTGSSGSFTQHVQNMLREDWDALQQHMATPGITGIPSGFRDYDLMLTGYNPGDLVFVAARPSMGKSAFLLRSVLNIAKNNIPTLVFSYEMSKKQLSQRMVSMESGVPMLDIKNATITDKQLELLKDTYLTISNFPIYVDTNMTASLGYVLSTIRRYVRASNVKVVFIDYVQLMVQDTKNETQELGRISRALKLLAGELGISIVVLSQLSRAVEQLENKRPQLSHLRQSGRMEEDADIVTMLYRPAYYGKVANDKENSLELLIRKNRNGPTGTVEVYFDPETVNIFGTLNDFVASRRS
jgi:replicative DNA helicase